MGQFYDMYKAYKEQQHREAGERLRTGSRIYFHGMNWGEVDSHGDVIMDGAFDPNRPERDKTVTSYYDPTTGKYFKCDINLDTFKKQEHRFWRHSTETKHDRFLRIFDVQDAVYLP